ncbi:hypothetical protein MRX96_008284 [Rhipicephalus microplus]
MRAGTVKEEKDVGGRRELPCDGGGALVLSPGPGTDAPGRVRAVSGAGGFQRAWPSGRNVPQIALPLPPTAPPEIGP